MNHNSDRLEPVDVWISQDAEGLILSPEEVRKRVALARKRVRRDHAIRTGAAVAGLLVWIAMLVAGDTAIRPWLYMAAMVAYFVLLTRLPGFVAAALSSSRPLTLELASMAPSCLEFYRKQLEIRRDALHQSRALLLIVAIFGLGLAVLGWNRTGFAIPSGLGLMFTSVVWYYRMKRESPGIQRELEELKAFTGNQ